VSLAGRIPADPRDRIWDFVVIGTGAGGGTAGFNLARLGRSVLFLERGSLLWDESVDEPSRRTGRARPFPYPWPDRIARKTSHGEEPSMLTVICGTGGSTSVYGMALDRFRSPDFTPRRFAANPDATTLPHEWPVPLEELEPFYAQAESLYRVRGTVDPLYPARSELRAMLPPSHTESLLHESLEECGLHPYRLHAAREHVTGCTGCSLTQCSKPCRNDAGRMCVLPALREHDAFILPECHVTRLETDGRRAVRAAVVMWKGRRTEIRARTFILALSALMTPALLLRSANERFPNGLGNASGLVGRNLMVHVSDQLLVHVEGHRDLVNASLSNGFSLNDFYVRDGLKLGNIHAHALRSQDSLASGTAGALLFRTIVEDFPYATNRVLPKPGSDRTVLWEYDHPDELRMRSRMLTDGFVEALHTRFSVTVARPEGQLLGHVCGTCRFGDDARSSVLDRHNRLHDLDNAYVVDASFFPSSSGINPSLTIIANSLRVTERLARA
jgi:choline dehydrogenase-like flavoprotein